jgi:dTDP-4-amino-4,6-dideoxygalactose transaminase
MYITPWPQADEREVELLRMVLESPQWGGFHPFVVEFEQSFAAFQHARFGISAANGSLTLELALLILGVGPGDEVIVPAISFISTATAVSRVGATPVFVDIEEDSYNLDPVGVRAALSGRTKAVLAVHFGGVFCDLPPLLEICREHNLFFLEDAAHAQGAAYDGQRAGSFGLAGSFSFQNGKILACGEGGMLITSDESFAEVARSIANCGRTAGRSFYEHARLGSNFRLPAFQAAVLLAQFERLPAQMLRRESNARLLMSLLGDVEQIAWQRQPARQTQNSYYLLTGRLAAGGEARNLFVERLQAAGVPCTPFYPHTLYRNSLYEKEPSRVMPCPVAEARVLDAFWISHRVLLADEETIHQVAAAIRRASEQASSFRARRTDRQAVLSAGPKP